MTKAGVRPSVHTLRELGLESLVTEVLHRVLQNGLADSLAAIASNRNAASILQALRIINESYGEEIMVENLAARVAMSVSAFHRHIRVE